MSYDQDHTRFDAEKVRESDDKSESDHACELETGPGSNSLPRLAHCFCGCSLAKTLFTKSKGR